MEDGGCRACTGPAHRTAHTTPKSSIHMVPTALSLRTLSTVTVAPPPSDKVPMDNGAMSHLHKGFTSFRQVLRRFRRVSRRFRGGFAGVLRAFHGRLAGVWRAFGGRFAQFASLQTDSHGSRTLHLQHKVSQNSHPFHTFRSIFARFPKEISPSFAAVSQPFHTPSRDFTTFHL